MTKEHFLELCQTHMEFSDLVRDIAVKMAKARKSTYYHPSESYRGFDVEQRAISGEYEITVEFDEIYSGNSNYSSFVIPNEYFWMTEDVEKVEEGRQAAFLANLAKLTTERKAAKELEEENEERALYEKLKAKYK